MGKQSAPPPPDYAAAAKETSAGNLAAAKQATEANRADQINPYGSLTWTQDPSGKWTQTTSLSNTGQQLFDQSNRTSLGLASLQDAATSRVANTFNGGWNDQNLPSGGTPLGQAPRTGFGTYPAPQPDQRVENAQVHGRAAQAPTATKMMDVTGVAAPTDNNWFVSPTTGNMVTWDATGKHTDTGQKAPIGAFGSGGPGDPQNIWNAQAAQEAVRSNGATANEGSNRGMGSVYNNWSDMPADTYDQYKAKMAVGSQVPLAAWLGAGTSASGGGNLSEADWNAQKARGTQSSGTSFGGSSPAPAVSGGTGVPGAVGQGGGAVYDPNSATNTATQAILARVNPQLARRRQAAESLLANQGITQGSEAWKNAQTDLGQQENDAYQQAGLAGINLGMGQQGQTFGQTLQNSQFGLGSQAQGFNQAQSARASGLAEQNYFANRDLNQLNALRTGSQVQNPTFGSYAQQQTTAGPDMLGAANMGYQAQLGGVNAANAGAAGTFAGLTSAAGLGLNAAFMFSDERLKKDIRRVGTLPSGIGLYVFTYNDETTPMVGLIAQDVQKKMPHAVKEMENGFLAVNYAEVLK